MRLFCATCHGPIQSTQCVGACHVLAYSLSIPLFVLLIPLWEIILRLPTHELLMRHKCLIVQLTIRGIR